MNKYIFESTILDNLFDSMNKDLFQKEEIYSDSIIGLNAKKEVLFKNFIKKYQKNYCDNKIIRGEWSPRLFSLTHGNIRYIFEKEDGVYKRTRRNFKKQIDENIFMGISKNEENKLAGLVFSVNDIVVNEIRYENYNGFKFCNLGNKEIYSVHDDFKEFYVGLVEDFVRAEIKIIGKEKTKELYLAVYDIYNLSTALYSIENDYFMDKFMESVLSGKNLLAKEKDLLHITHDINLDDYNYKTLFKNHISPKSRVEKIKTTFMNFKK